MSFPRKRESIHSQPQSQHVDSRLRGGPRVRNDQPSAQIVAPQPRILSKSHHFPVFPAPP
jgi:hypothetical protein